MGNTRTTNYKPTDYSLKSLNILKTEIEEIIKSRVGEDPNHFSVDVSCCMSECNIGSLDGFKCRDYLSAFKKLIVDLPYSLEKTDSVKKRIEDLEAYTRIVENTEKKLPELIIPVKTWAINNIDEFERQCEITTLTVYSPKSADRYLKATSKIETIKDEYLSISSEFIHCLNSYELGLKRFYLDSLEFLNMLLELMQKRENDISEIPTKNIEVRPKHTKELAELESLHKELTSEGFLKRQVDTMRDVMGYISKDVGTVLQVEIFKENLTEENREFLDSTYQIKEKLENMPGEVQLDEATEKTIREYSFNLKSFINRQRSNRKLPKT